MSQRKLLSNEECRRNVKRLAKVHAQAKSHYDAARVDELFELVQFQLFEEAIILGIKSEVNNLRALIMNALELNYSNVVFSAQVKRWIDNYRALEQAESAAVRKDAAKARGKNITESILAGEAIDSVWGDDKDLEEGVLLGYITNPRDPSSQFFSNETYVLPSAPFTSMAHVTAMVEQIQRVFSKAPACVNIKLLIPVNQVQEHWQLLELSLNKNKITSAVVIDNSDSKYLSASLTNLQLVVDKTNTEKEVRRDLRTPRVVADTDITGVKTDGNKCMHAVAQQVFKRKPARADDVTAQALANATSPLELLTGVVGKIFENRLNVATSAKDTAVKLDVEGAKAKVTADIAVAAAVQAQVEAKAKAKAEELAKEAASIKAQEEAAAKARAEEKARAKAQAEEQARKLAAEEAAKLKAQTKAVAKLKDTVRNIFTTEVNSEVIHKKLSAEENREIQIDFDHSLALELSKGDCDSADYFRASWKSAYSGMLNKYGLFTVDESKKAAEQLFAAEDATTKKTVK